MEKKHEFDEGNAAAEAAGQVAVAEEEVGPFVSGKPLPAGFVNPPGGHLGHRCLDPRGRYSPSWVQLKLHKTTNMPMRQYFNLNGRSWLVAVGQWVDVPPAVISVLNDCVTRVTRMDIDGVDLIAGNGIQKIVDEVPRFSYGMMPSA